MKTRVRKYSDNQNQLNTKRDDSLELNILSFVVWFFAIVMGLIFFRKNLNTLVSIIILITIFTLFIRFMSEKSNTSKKYIRTTLGGSVMLDLPDIKHSHKFHSFGRHKKHAQKKIYPYGNINYGALVTALCIWTLTSPILFGVSQSFTNLKWSPLVGVFTILWIFLSIPMIYKLLSNTHKKQVTAKKFWFLTQASKKEYYFFEYKHEGIRHYFIS